MRQLDKISHLHSPFERTKKRTEVDQSWAVSFCDILMIVMCFFVVFFEQDDDSFIELKIHMMDFFDKTASKRSTASVEKSKKNLNSVFEKLQFQTIRTEKKDREILLHFPDNIYGAGLYTPDENLEKLLAEFVATINDYRQEVNIEVIGHTDKTAWVQRKQKAIIGNDLRLGSMRAIVAAEYLIQKFNFHEDQVSISRKKILKRETRSLSFRLKMKADKRPGNHQNGQLPEVRGTQ